MLNNKKIIFIGPAGTGKTTIKQIFFDMGNPLYYLSNPLEPTKGMNSSIYTIFGTSMAIFDLAGQEMDSWLSSDRYVLNDASLIMCVFDINGYLQEIFKLIKKIFNFIAKKETINCSLVVFLHKIDTIDSLYAHHKLKATKDFVLDKFGKKINADVYLTSIDKAHFLNTYQIISKLFESLAGTRLFQDKITILNLENDLKILLEYDLEKPIEIGTLFYDLEIKRNEAMIPP
ncbi:MAG: Rab family GTPase [Promethearchaeota archaeon]